jgi:hypothetical protein
LPHCIVQGLGVLALTMVRELPALGLKAAGVAEAVAPMAPVAVTTAIQGLPGG